MKINKSVHCYVSEDILRILCFWQCKIRLHPGISNQRVSWADLAVESIGLFTDVAPVSRLARSQSASYRCNGGDMKPPTPGSDSRSSPRQQCGNVFPNRLQRIGGAAVAFYVKSTDPFEHEQRRPEAQAVGGEHLSQLA